MTLAQKKVARGVEVLDEKVPGWWKVIDLDTLRMSDCHHCMLGQLFGYDTERAVGAAVFGLSAEDHTYGSLAASGYHRGLRALHEEGSDIGCCNILTYVEGEESADFDELKCAWAEVIAERRASAEVSTEEVQ